MTHLPFLVVLFTLSTLGIDLSILQLYIYMYINMFMNPKSQVLFQAS